MSSPNNKTPQSLAKHLSETTLHSTRWLALKTLRYMDEAGTEREWNSVDRTTRSGSIDGVDIIATFIPIDETEPHIVLVSQYRPPVKSYCLEFPAGLSDAGETPEVTATRELLEETGLKVVKVNAISPILGMEVGMTSANCKIVHCNVEPIRLSQLPKQQLEDEEHITIHIVKVSGMLNFLHETSDRLGYLIDAKLWTFAFAKSL